MTVPNLITILRIILVPIFIIYMINQRTAVSLGIFLFASITDALDGFIARAFHQKSNLGAHLDPLADKILLMTAYIILAVFEMIPSWLTVLIISRDVIILLGVLILYLNQCPVRISPSLLGKATTCIQAVAVLIVLSSDYVGIAFLRIYAFWLVTLFTVVSGLQYIRDGMDILSQGASGDFT